MNGKFRLAVMSAAVAVTAVLAACTKHELADSTPPPIYDKPQPDYVSPNGLPPAYEPPTYAPPLPRFDDRPLPPPEQYNRPDLAGPPPPKPFGYQEPETVITMAPIPNPDRLTPEEYDRIYGPGLKAQGETARPAPRTRAPAPRTSPAPRATPAPRTAPAPRSAPAPRTTPVPAPRAAPAPRTTPAPVPAPKQSAPVAKPATPAPKATPAPAPKSTPAPTPAPKTTPAPAPKAPAAAPKAPVATPKVTPASDADRLGAVLSEEVANQSVLEIPDAIGEGGEGIVSLTLPPWLADRITTEAGKLGLGRAASNVEARASLSGEGYDINPSEPQAQRLKAGEAARFSWSVRPKENASGKLKAEVGADLRGGSRPQSFSIASIERAVAAEAAEESAGPKLDERWIAGGVLGILALILAALGLRALGDRREADRRRKAERRAKELGEYSGADDKKP